MKVNVHFAYDALNEFWPNGKRKVFSSSQVRKAHQLFRFRKKIIISLEFKFSLGQNIFGVKFNAYSSSIFVQYNFSRAIGNAGKFSTSFFYNYFYDRISLSRTDLRLPLWNPIKIMANKKWREKHFVSLKLDLSFFFFY